MQSIVNSKRNWTFTFIVFLILLTNLLATVFLDFRYSKLVRLITVVFLFFFYLSRKQYKNMWVKYGLLLFVIQNIFLQFYEYSLGFKGFVILGCMAYTMVVLECLRKFSLRFFNTPLVIIGGVLLVFNIYMLYYGIEILALEFRDSIEIALYYLHGSFMMILAVIAVAYNTKYNSSRSLRYTLLVFCFLISDVALLFAYYFEFDFMYIFSRMFFLTAVSIFVTYGLNYEIEREEHYQYEMINEKL